MPALFAFTLFLSAALLFLVQPMVGKMTLPHAGGSPAVWNTCMVFFQATLLLGYLYAHKVSKIADPKKQTRIHLGVLAASGMVLLLAAILAPNHAAVPVLPSLAPTDGGFPFFNVLAMLLVAVGIPFFAVSTSAPLLQNWFGLTGHNSAKDPYFLYAASNAGSLLSLLCYPIFTEPFIPVVQQTWLFAGGFALLFAMTALCGKAAQNPLRPQSLMPIAAETSEVPAPTGKQKARWLALAFVPSSLMLGVTTHLTTDIASIPLLWIGPLALYLVTFIIAFAKGSHRLRGVLGLITPVTTLLLIFAMTSGINLSVFVLVMLHLIAYFFIALRMHAELAAGRPHPKYLTTFYLWVSLGGVLGGIFNALIAPILFPLAFEYSIAIVLGCALLTPRTKPVDPATPEEVNRAGLKILIDVLIFFGMIVIVFALLLAERAEAFAAALKWVAESVNSAMLFCGIDYRIEYRFLGLLIVSGTPCLIAFCFIGRPLRFGLAALAIFFVFHYTQLVDKRVRVTARSYFGTLQIREDSGGKFRILSHGTTLHGSQFVPDEELEAKYPGLRYEAIMYYHRSGAVGDVFYDTFRRHPKGKVAMVGLGAGASAAYVGEGQSLTFYEIDPLVAKLVSGPAQFTYLSDAKARGANIEIVLGDARLTLARHTDRKYNLLLIDAFSSDSIPIHLMTVQAMKMYAERLEDDGLLAIHVSNRYLQLRPVVAAIAKECGLAVRGRSETVNDDNPLTPPGKTSSSWVVLAKSEALLESRFDVGATEQFGAVLGGLSFADEPRWDRIHIPFGVRAWTDDYADVPSVITSPEFQWFRRRLGFTTPHLK